eukprot:1190278-Prorocentrum_minimum.AAC.1
MTLSIPERLSTTSSKRGTLPPTRPVLPPAVRSQAPPDSPRSDWQRVRGAKASPYVLDILLTPSGPHEPPATPCWTPYGKASPYVLDILLTPSGPHKPPATPCWAPYGKASPYVLDISLTPS